MKPEIKITKVGKGHFNLDCTDSPVVIAVSAAPTDEGNGIVQEVCVAIPDQASKDHVALLLTMMVSSLLRTACSIHKIATDELYEAIGRELYNGKLFDFRRFTIGDK